MALEAEDLRRDLQARLSTVADRGGAVFADIWTVLRLWLTEPSGLDGDPVAWNAVEVTYRFGPSVLYEGEQEPGLTVHLSRRWSVPGALHGFVDEFQVGVRVGFAPEERLAALPGAPLAGGGLRLLDELAGDDEPAVVAAIEASGAVQAVLGRVPTRLVTYVDE